MTARLARVRARWIWVVVVVAVAWIMLISVLSMQEAGSEGATSPQQLAEQATSAIESGDAHGFAELLADPLTGKHDFAQSYLDALAAKGAGHVSVVAVSPQVVEVAGRGGTPFSYPLRLENTDGRWYLSFLPL